MNVYSIKNRKRHKRYIGATLNFDRRIREHLSVLRRNKHENGHLQSAWNKDGEESFVIRPVATAKSIEELDRLEDEYIELYGDYNIRSGGLKHFSHSEKSKRKMSETRRQRKIPSSTLGMTFKRTTEVKDKYARLQRPQGYPMLVSPNGKKIEVINARRFARENELWQTGVRQLVDGYVDCYKGWTRADTKYIDRGHTISSRKRPQGFPQVISPGGDMYSIEVLREFCRTHNLSVGNMSQLINGKKECYKGWTTKLEIHHG